MKTLKYELEKTARIVASGEMGEIIARAEYSQSEPQYLMRYAAADGRAVEAWWGESAIEYAA